LLSVALNTIKQTFLYKCRFDLDIYIILRKPFIIAGDILEQECRNKMDWIEAVK